MASTDHANPADTECCFLSPEEVAAEAQQAAASDAPTIGDVADAELNRAARAAADVAEAVDAEVEASVADVEADVTAAAVSSAPEAASEPQTIEELDQALRDDLEVLAESDLTVDVSAPTPDAVVAATTKTSTDHADAADSPSPDAATPESEAPPAAPVIDPDTQAAAAEALAAAKARDDAPAHEADAAHTAATDDENDADLPGNALHILTARVKAAGVRVLAALAFPLRFVPESQRKIVDWVALSLAFWSPIVWLLAWIAVH